MVKDGFTIGGRRSGQAAAERRVMLSYARADRRAGLAALLALDDALAAVLRTTREPMVGQLRLTWWHDALTALDRAPPPAEPVLVALAGAVTPIIPGARLATMVEGWEELLDREPPDDARLRRFAELRGMGLFEMAGTVIGATADDPLPPAGRAWALVDLAGHTADGALSARARAIADDDLGTAARARWSRAARPLGAMFQLARLDAAGAGRRTARMLFHRLTGF